MTGRAAPLLVALAFWPLASARAFNQPPANLASTTFLDGGGEPPGLYLLTYSQYVSGRQARDKDARAIPGGARISALAQSTQLFYLSPIKVLGGYLGFDALVPLAAITGQGALGPVAVTANAAGLGDLSSGLAVQWNDHLLRGRPFFHRFEIYGTFPTGDYDKNFAANPGSNVLSVEAYHAFTWLFTDAWETSWRMGYSVNGENRAVGVRPGQLFHVNYALSRSVHPKLRLGLAGYFMQQTTDDRINGASASGSRERAFAAGPGLAYTTPQVLLMLSHPMEFGVRNRFSGFRTTLQMILRL